METVHNTIHLPYKHDLNNINEIHVFLFVFVFFIFHKFLIKEIVKCDFFGITTMEK